MHANVAGATNVAFWESWEFAPSLHSSCEKRDKRHPQVCGREIASSSDSVTPRA